MNDVPPATIGILGGGQLGRMTALAARSMGYGVQVLDPSPDCAARPVVDRVVVAPFDDPEGAAELARAAEARFLFRAQEGGINFELHAYEPITILGDPHRRRPHFARRPPLRRAGSSPLRWHSQFRLPR